MYDAPCDISPGLQRRMAADRAAHWRNPHRCPDEAALRRIDTERDRATLWRPAFVRDIEKIMNVPAYNRASGKTQVFSFRQNDDIARRGLHVQLVARVARDIAGALGLNVDLVEAIALGHDIGHTPFGHVGERCLADKYRARTGRSFHHNVHSVEVLDRIYGRNVSLQVLDGILCHNGACKGPVFERGSLAGFDEFDARVRACIDTGERAVGVLAPATLEGCVVRISDIIAYVGRDRQDAEVAGLLAPSTHFATGACGGYNSWVLQALTVDIVENSYGKDHIEMSRPAFEELMEAKRENYELIYHSPEVEGDCVRAVRPRFERLYDHLLEDLASGDESRPIYACHIVPVCRHAGYYGSRYDWESDPDRTVVDFIAGMTDDFFIALCNLLVPEEGESVPLRSYFDCNGCQG